MNANVLDDKSWQPDPKMDSRHYLWDILFKVRVPKQDLMSEGYLKVVGVRVSGDQDTDDIMRDEVVMTWMNIDKIAEIFRVGGRVRIMDFDDCVKVHTYIDNHLEAWKQHLERSSINKKTPPVDDLLLLDELSDAVFRYARWDFAREDHLSYLKRHLGTEYKYSIAALQEAIPTMASIMAKQKNKDAEESGSKIRIATADEVVTGVGGSFDAFHMKKSLTDQTDSEIEKQLPKRPSYARYFEEFREDKSISKLAPELDARFAVPNRSMQSMNNRLGRNSG